jgi:hypothetical protein
MGYNDELMQKNERWLYWSGLVLGLALYQMVDIYWLRPYRDSALRAYARSANECVARSHECSENLASCQERQSEALQSKLSGDLERQP